MCHRSGTSRLFLGSKSSSRLPKRLGDPMFSFDQTSVASERNNKHWLSGVPDCCGVSEGRGRAQKLAGIAVFLCQRRAVSCCWLAKPSMNHPLRTLLRELFVDPVLWLLPIWRPKRLDTLARRNSEQRGSSADDPDQSRRPVSQCLFTSEEIRKET
jgi:hypothetical protein